MYYGIPEGSKLYSVKMWDKEGKLIYVGCSSRALNEQTGKEENCWRWYAGENNGYDFAYYHADLSGRKEYGRE